MEKVTEELSKLAHVFRQAIELCDRSQLPISFQSFPRGSCGDTCDLLAKWLEENGQTGFYYVCGWRQGGSHAWLERDGIILDITADQFVDMKQSVIVTDDPTWHETFGNLQRHYADFETYNSHTVAVLRMAYSHIRAAICIGV